MKVHKKYDTLNSSKSVNRETHFESGGTPRQWLPYKQIIKSRKYRKPKHKSKEE